VQWKLAERDDERVAIMADRTGTVLVLWAPRFDEVAAVVFVAGLRSAGLRVALVSLTRQQTGGAYGLCFVPDLTLEEALPLAGEVACVVIPCNSPDVRRLARDPRVRELFCLVQEHHAAVVVGQAAAPILAELQLILPSNGDLLTFSPGEAMVQFADKLADELSPVI
jgi:hypothetical protein